MTMDLIITLVFIIGIAFSLDKIYGKINLEKYSPIWEYFLKHSSMD